MEGRCQICNKPILIKRIGARKKYCGSMIEKTGCVYEKWKQSLVSANLRRKERANEPKEESREEYKIEIDLMETISEMWRQRDGRSSEWVADTLGIPLAKVNFYIVKLTREVS
jgi:hypothetical protein